MSEYKLSICSFGLSTKLPSDFLLHFIAEAYSNLKGEDEGDLSINGRIILKRI
jgi:hypothetical protein